MSGGKLVIASHNPGKVREIAELLAPHGLSVVSAASLALPEPEENGTTFTENAVLKASAAARASGLPALADDSGIAVTALGGRPGIYSARWARPGAGPDKDFAVAMQRVEQELGVERELRIERELSGAADRSAAFICVLCLAWPEGRPGGRPETFEGRVTGTLVWPPRGGNGFGYDPMFVPEDHRQTFGEMDPAAKRGLSHRARAFAKLLARGFADL